MANLCVASDKFGSYRKGLEISETDLVCSDYAVYCVI